MVSVLRIYKPDECSADGIPLDWDRCRACAPARDLVALAAAEGMYDLVPVHQSSAAACSVCDSHGSLKAAVLAELTRCICDGESGRLNPGCPRTKGDVPRCESCSHQMSEGTWEGRKPADDLLGDEGLFERMADLLRRRIEPAGGPFHYSACDSLCDHGEPFRYRVEDNDWDYVTTTGSPVRGVRVAGEMVAARGEVEASWRSVDIRVGMVAKRTLGDRFDPGKVLQVRPFDLTRENVSVLCLRCWAAPI